MPARSSRCRSLLALLAFLFAATSAHAATFIVPPDRVLVTASKAIVVAVAGESHGRWAPGGWIETVTELHVDEVIKGTVVAGQTMQVTELGGFVDGIGYFVAGSPRYASGSRVLLFLETNDRGEWVAKNMAVGKFDRAQDVRGRRLLLRDAEEIVGWETDGLVHREPVRLEDAFLQFVRTVANGGDGTDDYIVRDPQPLHRVAVAEATTSGFAPSGYLLQAGGVGIRWPNFPSAVVFLSHGTQPNALQGGLTALQRGLAAWTNDPGSNIVYTYGGTTAIASTGFNSNTPDRVNTIQFNDPSNEIPGSFSGKGGDTLAIGGAWSGAATHSANGEQYFSIIEADLVVQDGITGPGISGNGFDHVITHELGHTLGLRHSDRNSSDGACSAPLDCSTAAIDAVYGAAGVPACNAPRITTSPQTVNVETTAVTFSVIATGDAPLQYQWYTGTSGQTNLPIAGATSSSLTIKPAVTTGYWVRITGSCDPPADSGTAYAIVNSCPPVVIGSQSDPATILEGRSSALSVAASGGTVSFQWYTGASGVTTSLITGATSSTLTVTPSATTSYWVRVANSCGSSADSGTIVISVLPCTAPRIVIQPASGSVVAGNSVSLFATVTGTQPISYQWYGGLPPDKSQPALNGTSATLTLPALFAPAAYWLHVESECGSADSNTARLTVVSSCTTPSITQQPRDQSVTPGASAIIAVVASGPSIAYQWYQGSRADFTHPVGGNSPSLFVPALTTATPYFVRISSPCGTEDSAVATLSVAVPPRRHAVRR